MCEGSQAGNSPSPKEYFNREDIEPFLRGGIMAERLIRIKNAKTFRSHNKLAFAASRGACTVTNQEVWR